MVDSTAAGANDGPDRSPTSADRWFLIRTDDGIEHRLNGRTIVGSAPAPGPTESELATITLIDRDATVSESHAVFDLVDGRLQVSDLGSEMGTIVIAGGVDAPVPASSWVDVGVGTNIKLGDRVMTIVYDSDVATPVAVSDPPRGHSQQNPTETAQQQAPDGDADETLGDRVEVAPTDPADRAQAGSAPSPAPLANRSAGPPTSRPSTSANRDVDTVGAPTPTYDEASGCGACGAATVPGQRFCVHCGANLRTVAATGVPKAEHTSEQLGDRSRDHHRSTDHHQSAEQYLARPSAVGSSGGDADQQIGGYPADQANIDHIKSEGLPAAQSQPANQPQMTQPPSGQLPTDAPSRDRPVQNRPAGVDLPTPAPRSIQPSTAQSGPPQRALPPTDADPGAARRSVVQPAPPQLTPRYGETQQSPPSQSAHQPSQTGAPPATGGNSLIPPRIEPKPPGGSSGGTGALLVIAGVIGLVLVIAVLAVLALRGGSSDERTSTVPMLPSDPSSQWEATVERSADNLDGIDELEMTGTPERLFVWNSGGDGEIIAYDADGEERWNDTVEGRWIESYEGDLLVLEDRGDDLELRRLDGDDGAELWSTSVSSFTKSIYDGKMYLSNDLGDVTAIDLATGEVVAEASFALAIRLAIDLPLTGSFVAYEDANQIVVVDHNLETISEVIEVEETSAAAYQNDVVVVAEDDRLIRYGLDGDELANGEFKPTQLLFPIGGSSWAFANTTECGVVEFSGDEVQELWNAPSCVLAPGALHADGTPALLLATDTNLDLVTADSGDVLFSTEFGEIWNLFGNGVTTFDGDTLTGFQLPSGDEAFSQPIGDNDYYVLFDRGYAVVKVGPAPSDDFEIEVFG